VALLDRARIPKRSCFFTNFYTGLRAGLTTTGKFPGASNEAFSEHCGAFLLDQLRTQRPQLILTLGIHVPPFHPPSHGIRVDWLIGDGSGD
jgi:hypothetical protein